MFNLQAPNAVTDVRPFHLNLKCCDTHFPTFFARELFIELGFTGLSILGINPIPPLLLPKFRFLFSF